MEENEKEILNEEVAETENGGEETCKTETDSETVLAEEAKAEEVKEVKPNPPALVSGILNLVGGILMIAFAVFYVLGILGFSSADVPSEKALGLIIMAVIFFPMMLIVAVPAGVAGGIYEIVRAVIWFVQAKGSEDKPSLWALIVEIVIKVILAVVIGFCAFMYLALSEFLPALLTYSAFGIAVLGIVTSFVAIGFEFKARKR